jgi:putative methyltransferase (TIGR04325 family)
MKIIKYIPPIIIDVLKHSIGVVIWQGVYSDWNKALKKTDTYATDEILYKVSEATTKVLLGEYPYERDGVVFNEMQYNFPLLTCFGYVAAKNVKNSSGQLSVVDFGGSLGSSYISNKWFLQNSVNMWIVVEQPHFVDRGKHLFAGDKTVRFAKDIDDILATIKGNNKNNIDVAMFSSVLQYLEKPHELLQQYIRYLSPKYIIVDRTSFSDSNAFVSLQRVKKGIVKSSYPIHFLNWSGMLSLFEKYDYQQIIKFDSFCDPVGYKVNNHNVGWKGCLFQRKD